MFHYFCRFHSSLCTTGTIEQLSKSQEKKCFKIIFNKLLKLDGLDHAFYFFRAWTLIPIFLSKSRKTEVQDSSVRKHQLDLDRPPPLELVRWIVEDNQHPCLNIYQDSRIQELEISDTPTIRCPKCFETVFNKLLKLDGVDQLFCFILPCTVQHQHILWPASPLPYSFCFLLPLLQEQCQEGLQTYVFLYL